MRKMVHLWAVKPLVNISEQNTITKTNVGDAECAISVWSTAITKNYDKYFNASIHLPLHPGSGRGRSQASRET